MLRETGSRLLVARAGGRGAAVGMDRAYGSSGVQGVFWDDENVLELNSGTVSQLCDSTKNHRSVSF